MGAASGQNGRLGGSASTVRLAIELVDMERTAVVRVSMVDQSPAPLASAEIAISKDLGPEWLREALWNALAVPLRKAGAGAVRGSDTMREWNAQAMAREVLRLLRLGVAEDRKVRGVGQGALDDDESGIPEPAATTD